MIDYEKLGVFYLGKEYDELKNKLLENLILYDSKDLTTHALCVGMTGSGKTGLCIGILEEAAIDKIPAIIIDPKGDLSNLLLTFPDLKPGDFKNWISEEEAAKKGITLDQLAEKKASDWEKGLESWGENKDRIKKLKESADFEIYTPGSNAGKQVSVLSSLDPPEEKILNDDFSLRETILGVTSALLNLIGINADSIKSKETILITNIIEFYWKQKKNLTLAELIKAITKPPLSKVGVFDIETFYPSKERFDLAMQINNLLASPGFSGWMEGESFKIQNFFYNKDGKIKHSIFSIAHLNNTERMFFVTLLLNQLINWMRTQPGTTSLRAILYMDEIFGYFPPVANPPSKIAMLTLLKQARAFGLGVVLATQNPVDLDYKGLSNIGTWFIGRLQTEQDKNRVIDGLQSAMETGGKHYSKDDLNKIISGLESRIFLMNNVHENAPVIFQTRWVMSFLCGPLTRVQISELMKDKKDDLEKTKSKSEPINSKNISQSRPIIPSQINQKIVPLRLTKPGDNYALLYKPFLFGSAIVNIKSSKNKIDHNLNINSFFSHNQNSIEWKNAVNIQLAPEDFLKEPEEKSAGFASLQSDLLDPKNYSGWEKDFENYLYREISISIYTNENTGLSSKPEETEKDFRIRLTQSLRELRDNEVEKLRNKYEKETKSFEEKIRKAQQKLENENQQYDQKKIQTIVSIGSTILGALFGRKTFSRTNANRVGSTISKASRAYQEKQDIAQVQEDIKNYNLKIEELNNKLEEEIKEISANYDPDNIKLDKAELKPRKSGIDVKEISLAWLPFWRSGESLTEAYE